MKKNIIIAVVILAAALIALKYFASREQDSISAPAPAAQTAPEGVPLPDTARDNGRINADSSSSAPPQSAGSYDTLTLPEAVLAQKGSCAGGSPKEIMDNHGKTWGYFTGRRIAFNHQRTQEMYNFVGEYYACLAVARRDLGVCGGLPGEVGQATSPMGSCRHTAGEFLFKAYVAGKAGERENCMGFLDNSTPENLNRISPADFCAAAGDGPEKIMSYWKEKLPEVYPQIVKEMAFFKKDCGADPVCLFNNAVWESIRTGKPDKCPPSYRPFCEAFMQKTQVPCITIVMEMSRKYCAYYKELLKAGGGYAGETADEVKEALRQQAQKKAGEDQRRKEQEAITREINARVKKMVGTEGE